MYFAKEDLEAKVTVELSAIGFTGRAPKKFAVKTLKNEAGCEIIRRPGWFA